MPTKTVIDGIAGLEALAGKELGKSDWKKMSLEDIVRFADATGDHQWIHVDRERARRESPFGVPIAHGYFTVGLIAGLFFEIVEPRNFAMVINYGLNKVRFPAPLKEGQRYRLSVKLNDAKQVSNAVEALMTATMEIEGESKPACVAEIVYRFYGAR
ncbi:MAG TPA: MaoC family dehydratase [Myxococcales bacterium]|jgi:acyl dehydratase|nr:MaoC family dehydratase [Myxococcales bacterium]